MNILHYLAEYLCIKWSNFIFLVIKWRSNFVLIYFSITSVTNFLIDVIIFAHCNLFPLSLKVIHTCNLLFYCVGLKTICVLMGLGNGFKATITFWWMFLYSCNWWSDPQFVNRLICLLAAYQDQYRILLLWESVHSCWDIQMSLHASLKVLVVVSTSPFWF